MGIPAISALGVVKNNPGHHQGSHLTISIQEADEAFKNTVGISDYQKMIALFSDFLPDLRAMALYSMKNFKQTDQVSIIFDNNQDTNKRAEFDLEKNAVIIYPSFFQLEDDCTRLLVLQHELTHFATSNGEKVHPWFRGGLSDNIFWEKINTFDTKGPRSFDFTIKENRDFILAIADASKGYYSEVNEGITELYAYDALKHAGKRMSRLFGQTQVETSFSKIYVSSTLHMAVIREIVGEKVFDQSWENGNIVPVINRLSQIFNCSDSEARIWLCDPTQLRILAANVLRHQPHKPLRKILASTKLPTPAIEEGLKELGIVL